MDKSNERSSTVTREDSSELEQILPPDECDVVEFVSKFGSSKHSDNDDEVVVVQSKPAPTSSKMQLTHSNCNIVSGLFLIVTPVFISVSQKHGKYEKSYQRRAPIPGRHRLLKQ